MPTEVTTVIRVKEDRHTLEAGGKLTIAFNPDEGAGLIAAHVQNAPEDVIMGKTPDRFGENPAPADVGVAPVDDDAGPEIANPIAPTTRGLVIGGIVFGGTGGVVDGVMATGDVPEVMEAVINPFPINQPGFGGELVVDPGDPLPPPEPRDAIRLEILRPDGNGGMETVLNETVPSASGESFVVNNLPLVPEGFGREAWVARFTNLAGKPMQMFGRVLFRERTRVEVTTVPFSLISRLLRQAVRGLGLKIRLKGDTISVDLDHVVKELTKFHGIEVELGRSYFGDINLADVRLKLGQARTSDNRGPFPSMILSMDFEEKGPELDIDIGTDVEINFKNLGFEVEVILRQLIRNLDPAGAVNDTALPPYINAEVNFKSGIKFKSDTAGAIVDGGIAVADFLSNLGNDDEDREKITSFNDAVNAAGQDIADALAWTISQAVQLGLNRMADQFYGLRLTGEDWQILTGPVLPEPPREPAAPAVQPLADPQPIDGPQPASELENLNRIDHFVVLMMENRSYDHVLGYLSHPSHGNRTAYEGLRGNEINKTKGLQDGVVFPLETTKFFPGPPHGFEPVLEQINNGRMSGFGDTFKDALTKKQSPNDARSIMGYNPPGHFPTYDLFVRDFAVAKRWFAAHPGPTWPNRFCTMCGRTPILRNGDLPSHDLGYLTTPTLFDLLSEGNVDWRVYEHDVTFLRMFDRYRLDIENIRHFSRFAQDVRNGLPAATFIEPNFVDIPGDGFAEGDKVSPANDDHPGGADITNGQRLIAQIYNTLIGDGLNGAALARVRRQWENTLFIVTYDEHGGFFDHVPPPGSEMAQGQGLDEVQKVHPDGPSMLGVRVPSFIVSPRAERGAILERIYDHTSIAKSIIARFLEGQEHRLSRRVETAAHLGGAVPLAQPRTDFVAYPVPNEVSPPGHEDLEALSFHDDMISLGNPMREPSARLQKMLPIVGTPPPEI